MNNQDSRETSFVIEPRFRLRGLDHGERIIGVRTIPRLGSNVLIVGPPGSGKTTALHLLKDQLDHQKNNVTVLIGAWDGLDTLDSVVDHYKPGYRVTVLIDGLDEIHPDQQGDALNTLSQFVASRPAIHVIATTRLSPYSTTKLDEFIVASILPWDTGQVEQYLRRSLAWTDPQIKRWTSTAFAPLLRTPVFVKVFARYNSNLVEEQPFADPVSVLSRAVDGVLLKAAGPHQFSPYVLASVLERTALVTLRRSEFTFGANMPYQIGRQLGLEIDSRMGGVILETGLVVQTSSEKLSFSHLFLHELFATRSLRRQVKIHDVVFDIDPGNDAFIAFSLTGPVDSERVVADARHLGAVPLHTRSGSLIILFGVLGVYVLLRMLEKFADGFATRLGEHAADSLVSSRQPEIPREMLKGMPNAIRSNPNTQQVYVEEFAREWARNDVRDDRKRRIITTHVRAALAAIYPSQISTVEAGPLLKDIGIDHERLRAVLRNPDDE